MVGEGHLLLGRGNVLVVAKVPQHVPAARLALCGCLMSTLEVQLHLVQSRVKVLHTGFKSVLLMGVPLLTAGEDKRLSSLPHGHAPLVS